MARPGRGRLPCCSTAGWPLPGTGGSGAGRGRCRGVDRTDGGTHRLSRASGCALPRHSSTRWATRAGAGVGGSYRSRRGDSLGRSGPARNRRRPRHPRTRSATTRLGERRGAPCRGGRLGRGGAPLLANGNNSRSRSAFRHDYNRARARFPGGPGEPRSRPPREARGSSA